LPILTFMFVWKTSFKRCLGKYTRMSYTYFPWFTFYLRLKLWPLFWRYCISCYNSIVNHKRHASCSDRPFTVCDVEDELSFSLSTKILSVALLETFLVPFEKFRLWDIYVNKKLSCFFHLFYWESLYLCCHILKFLIYTF
jgi:hypothetical protein